MNTQKYCHNVLTTLYGKFNYHSFQWNKGTYLLTTK